MKLTGTSWAEKDLFDRMEAALKRAKLFIEYAKPELVPGHATISSIYPGQSDADEVIAYINEVL